MEDLVYGIGLVAVSIGLLTLFMVVLCQQRKIKDLQRQIGQNYNDIDQRIRTQKRNVSAKAKKKAKWKDSHVILYVISNSMFSNRAYSVGDIVYCRGGHRTLGGYNQSGKQ